MGGMKELAKICPNCGKQNKITAKFCENCGTDLSNVRNTSEPKKEVKSTSGGLMGFWNKQSTKGKATIGIVGLCCIGLILIVGISGLMAPDKTTTYSSPASGNGSGTASSNAPASDTPSQSNLSTSDSSDTSSSSNSGVQIQVSYSGSWQGSYGDEAGQQSVDGSGTKTYSLDNPTIVSACFQKMDSGHGTLTVKIIKDGSVVQTKSTSAQYGVVSVSASV